MYWGDFRCWGFAWSLVVACAGRTESSSDVTPSPSGGHRNVTSGGTSGGSALGPSNVGGSSLTRTIDPWTLAGTNCGNARLDPNEQCDDGNRIRGDGCTAICQVEPTFECPRVGQPCIESYRCGDGVVDGTNLCDDGNQTSGDGCDASCTTIEPGWQCRVPGRPCVPLCGDGLRTGAEECDEGPSNGTYQQGQIVACSLACKLVAHCQSGDVTVICPSACGNGLLELTEQCDLGASNADAEYGGCSTQCKLGPYCGDGVVNGTEACDPGLDPVAIYGQPGCTTACEPGRYCGDGSIDEPFGEFCDGGQACAPDCSPYLGP